MGKLSKKAEDQKWAALEGLADARDAVEMEVMQQVFDRLPYGQKFALSDGSVCDIEKLAEPELCSNQNSDYYLRPCFGFDVVIEGGPLDHVEVYAFTTGSGMAVAPRTAGAKATAPLPATSDGDVTGLVEKPGTWTASRGRRAGDHSATRPSRTEPKKPGMGGQSLGR
jgi:hypothetical protein